MTDTVYLTARRGLSQAAGALLVLIACLLALAVALVAIALGLQLLRLPYELFVVLQRRPIAFPLHMIASGLALLLIPMAVWARRRRNLHRLTGRAAAIRVAAGGASALLVALASVATPGIVPLAVALATPIRFAGVGLPKSATAFPSVKEAASPLPTIK